MSPILILLAGNKNHLYRMKGAVLPYFYIFLLIFGFASIHVNKLGTAHIKRQKEKELLFVGAQYRVAIERYFQVQQTYPKELKLLVKDPRFINKRYIRRLYIDPLSFSEQWGLIYAQRGGISGVFSLGEGKPLKQRNFDPAFTDFENAERYQDWRFQYVPPAL